MCGRFVRSSTAVEIVSIFDCENRATDLALSFNICPTSIVYGIIQSKETRSLVDLSWGLVPRWSKDATRAASLINARSETVGEKPSFRDLISQHRCVIPMNGYFEWQSAFRHDESTTTKQPFYFTARPNSQYCHHGLFAVAGLWTTWRSPDSSQVITSCVVLTRDANDFVSKIHDRMPVLLTASDVDKWLDPTTLSPVHAITQESIDATDVRAVGAAVNSSRNNSPSLIDPVDLTLVRPDEQGRLF
ncbi:MAG: SOS response-associated peptidase [Actinobacteria bacterium]|nr:MAG: SOS response-associated peptidase [Actinomycetota bacterium]